jgi:hypothetical protein
MIDMHMITTPATFAEATFFHSPPFDDLKFSDNIVIRTHKIIPASNLSHLVSNEQIFLSCGKAQHPENTVPEAVRKWFLFIKMNSLSIK